MTFYVFVRHFIILYAFLCPKSINKVMSINKDKGCYLSCSTCFHMNITIHIMKHMWHIIINRGRQSLPHPQRHAMMLRPEEMRKRWLRCNSSSNPWRNSPRPRRTAPWRVGRCCRGDELWWYHGKLMAKIVVNGYIGYEIIERLYYEWLYQPIIIQ